MPRLRKQRKRQQQGGIVLQIAGGLRVAIRGSGRGGRKLIAD
tara:strand:- start:145 stop:270 length:126 start_codon:yes stop_codon:yes gene_type:complete